MGFRYANIIVNITNGQLDRCFQYLVPEAMREELRTGNQVEIPFGSGNRLISGYVVELTDRAEYEEGKLKEISRILDRGVAIETRLIALAAWMKERYGSTMLQALKTVLPIKEKVARREETFCRLTASRQEGETLLSCLQTKNQKARARFLEALLEKGILSSAQRKELKISADTVRFFLDQGVVALEKNERFRNPADKIEVEEDLPVTLNEEQRYVVEEITRQDAQEKPGTYLLWGITGSGKTEVYMELISRQAKKGKQSIVLIPEIALTYQTVKRFRSRFGNRVSILNSRMSAGERYDQFQRAKNGELDVMIGPRSALFTPFPNLGFIVIDEEQEDSYQSETAPRYHAREVAAFRARDSHASLLLGSATPSVEAFEKAKNGEITLFRLRKRAKEESSLPKVSVVDLREELKSGNKSMFSSYLSSLIEDRLEKKQQIMLFLNRRGYSSFLSCRMCGHVFKCPHCDVSLTLHEKRRLICHYCGYEEPAPKRCPECGSPYIAAFGTGTQKVEEAVKKTFPGARVLRMDYDTTSKKGGHEEILRAFSRKEADILVGTQMIVKGHDFPDVTLVGILAADLSLSAPDYRAAEKTFQLLTQAAGRTGRGRWPGEAVIQTYQPEHYSIKAAAAQDYEAFFEEEMQYRRLLHYPPACRFMTVQLSSREEEQAETLSKEAARLLSGYQRNKRVLSVIGPGKPAVGKKKDIYYRLLYVKSESLSLLIQMKDELEEWAAARKENIYLQFEIR